MRVSETNSVEDDLPGRPPVAAFALVAAVSALAIACSLTFLGLPYCSDDHWLIGTLHGRDLRELVQISLLGADHEAPGLFWRPIWRASFWLDANLWPDRSTWSHALNLVAHAFAVATTARFALRSQGSVRFAFAVGVLLAVQPAGLEAVAWVASRGDTLALAFGSLAAASLLAEPRPRGLVVGCLWLLAAFASKEPGLAFAPAVAAGAVFARRPRAWRIARAALPLALGLGWVLLRARVLGDWIGSYPGSRDNQVIDAWAASQRLDMLGEVVLWGAVDDPRAESKIVIAVAVASVLALALLRGSRRVLGAFGLALLGASAVMWHGVGAPGIEQADNRFYYLPATGWVLFLCSLGREAVLRRRASTWLVGGATAGLVLALGVLRVRLLDAHTESGERIRAFYAQLRAEAEADERPLLLLDTPDEYGPLLCAQYCLPFAIVPPFGEGDPTRQVGAMTRRFFQMAILPPWALYVAMLPGARMLSWDAASGSFVDGDFCEWETFARGRVREVERDGTQTRIQLVNPASPTVVSADVPFELVPGECVEIQSIAEPCRPDEVAAVRVERREPLLVLEGTRLLVTESPRAEAPESALVMVSRVPSWTPLGPNGLLLLDEPGQLAALLEPTFPAPIELGPVIANVAPTDEPFWLQAFFLYSPTREQLNGCVYGSELLRLDLR